MRRPASRERTGAAAPAAHRERHPHRWAATASGPLQSQRRTASESTRSSWRNSSRRPLAGGRSSRPIAPSSAHDWSSFHKPHCSAHRRGAWSSSTSRRRTPSTPARPDGGGSGAGVANAFGFSTPAGHRARSPGDSRSSCTALQLADVRSKLASSESGPPPRLRLGRDDRGARAVGACSATPTSSSCRPARLGCPSEITDVWWLSGAARLALVARGLVRAAADADGRLSGFWRSARMLVLSTGCGSVPGTGLPPGQGRSRAGGPRLLSRLFSATPARERGVPCEQVFELRAPSAPLRRHTDPAVQPGRCWVDSAAPTGQGRADRGYAPRARRGELRQETSHVHAVATWHPSLAARRSPPTTVRERVCARSTGAPVRRQRPARRVVA